MTWRILACLAIIGVITLIAVAADNRTPSQTAFSRGEVIRVSTLLLVDEAGTVRGSLSADKAGAMIELRSKGFWLKLHVDDNSARISIDSEESSQNLVDIMAVKDGGAVELSTSKGRTLFRQGVKLDKGYGR